MKTRRFLKVIIPALAILVLFLTCKTSDLRTETIKNEGINADNQQKAKIIVGEALMKMNAKKWLEHKTYEVIGSDYWYPLLFMNLSPWPAKNGAKIRHTFATNTFDSKIQWLDGKLMGEVMGIQSWQLYRKEIKGDYSKIKKDSKISFILPTIHYFNELLIRLSNAQIVVYAGEEKIGDDVFDLIFCTWDSPKPNKHDQYLMYINQKNKRLERVSYTIRDNYMWTPKSFYGTAVYSDFKEVDDITIPFKMEVFPFGQTKKMKVHTYTIESIIFDPIFIEALYPFEGVKKLGDSK